MTNFGLTDKEMSRLQEKFREFQQTRNTIMIFLVSYIADYQNKLSLQQRGRILLERQKYRDSIRTQPLINQRKY